MELKFTKLINTILEQGDWDNGVKIHVWSEEDEDQDYTALDQLEEVFSKANIGVSRNKEPGVYITIHGNVVAGSYYEMRMTTTDDDEAREYMEGSFDIAVDPQYQKYGMGNALIKENLALLQSMSDGFPLHIKLWVVNQKAKDLLEIHYGFEETVNHGDNNWYMEKWL